MAELHRFGLAAVLSADAADKFGTRGTAFLHTHVDELANTFLVENLEGVYLQDLLL